MSNVCTNLTVHNQQSINSPLELENQRGYFFGNTIRLIALPVDLYQKLKRAIGTGHLKTLVLQRCFTSSHQLHEILGALKLNENAEGLWKLDIRHNPIDAECTAEICILLEKRGLRILSLPPMNEMQTVQLLDSTRKVKIEELIISGSLLNNHSIKLLESILRERNVTKLLNLKDCLSIQGEELTRRDMELLQNAERKGRLNFILYPKLKIIWFSISDVPPQKKMDSFQYEKEKTTERDVMTTVIEEGPRANIGVYGRQVKFSYGKRPVILQSHRSSSDSGDEITPTRQKNFRRSYLGERKKGSSKETLCNCLLGLICISSRQEFDRYKKKNSTERDATTMVIEGGVRANMVGYERQRKFPQGQRPCIPQSQSSGDSDDEIRTTRRNKLLLFKLFKCIACISSQKEKEGFSEVTENYTSFGRIPGVLSQKGFDCYRSPSTCDKQDGEDLEACRNQTTLPLLLHVGINDARIWTEIEDHSLEHQRCITPEEDGPFSLQSGRVLRNDSVIQMESLSTSDKQNGEKLETCLIQTTPPQSEHVEINDARIWTVGTVYIAENPIERAEEMMSISSRDTDVHPSAVVQRRDIVTNRRERSANVAFAIFQKQMSLKMCLWDPSNDEKAQSEMKTLEEDDYDFVLRSEARIEELHHDICVSLGITEPKKYLLPVEERRKVQHFIELTFNLPEEAINEEHLEITYNLHDETGTFCID